MLLAKQPKAVGGSQRDSYHYKSRAGTSSYYRPPQEQLGASETLSLMAETRDLSI